MNKKRLVVAILSTSLLVGGLTSCIGSDNSIYTSTFVEKLAAEKGLTPADGKYVYQEVFVDRAIEYTYTLTCTGSDSFSYIFNSKCVKKVTSSDSTVEGYVTSSINFLWGRFTSSLFKSGAELIKGTTKDTCSFEYYGLLFNDDGTVADSCYSYTIESQSSDFNSIDVFNSGWYMTRLQIKHLNILTQELVGCYLW